MNSSKPKGLSVPMTNLEAILLLSVNVVVIICLFIFASRLSAYHPNEDSEKNQSSIISVESLSLAAR